MFQESQDHRHVQVLDIQLARLCPQPLRGEGHQQLEAVSVGLTGVRTGTAIAGQDDRDELGVCLEPPQFVTDASRISTFKDPELLKEFPSAPG